ncbi:glycosyltransferase family 2 protein [Micromonospora sp. NBC_00858]|uniref:glycosyltransferase family 2 protein n=1 Tax=Micromonospora sp. NBC_00858 TaxID=2975979 RepID=UPI00386AB8AC|nr:glycosyltransferase family 2 protein [Micromonospora sp. NBC_00858]
MRGGADADRLVHSERAGIDGVRVIRKPNGGKASALNTGLLYASHDIIVTLDADTVFEPNAIRRLIEPFNDPRIGAVAGNVKVANRRRLLGQWQHIGSGRAATG